MGICPPYVEYRTVNVLVPQSGGDCFSRYRKRIEPDPSEIGTYYIADPNTVNVYVDRITGEKYDLIVEVHREVTDI